MAHNEKIPLPPSPPSFQHVSLQGEPTHSKWKYRVIQRRQQLSFDRTSSTPHRKRSQLRNSPFSERLIDRGTAHRHIVHNAIAKCPAAEAREFRERCLTYLRM